MTAKKPTVDKTPERVRGMFGEIAPKYDFLNNLLSVGLAPRWRRRLVREVFKRLDAEFGETGEDRQARTVETLDVATGTGDVVIEERRQFERKPFAASLRTVGVDFVPQMLELARKKAPGVEFLEGDGLNLPFEANRFDAATVSFGLRNMVDPERGVAELIRVCRPGGVVAILEFSPTKFPIFAPIFRFYFHRILPKIGQTIAKNRSDAYRYLPESVDAFDSPDEILEYMRRNGIAEPRRIPMTFGVLGLFIGRKTA